MAIVEHCEWIGGRLTAPFYVGDGADVDRALVIVWMEIPSGLVVGCDVAGPDEGDGALGRALRAALARPLTGLPRHPDAVRVADASLAAEVRTALERPIPVTIAPTPELDAVLEGLLEAMRNEQRYLDEAGASEDSVGRFFYAAQMLWTVKPWERVDDGQVLRLDIPALGIDGACVSVVGALGEHRGLMIFPSLEACDAFVSAAEQARFDDDAVDLGTGWLAVSFQPAAMLSSAMRQEVEAHAWPVASPDAYPTVERWERDGTARPLLDHDFPVATAGARSLASFFARRGTRLTAQNEFVEPVSESFFDEADLEVRVTYPYEVLPSVDRAAAFPPIEPETPFTPSVGRNAPCPCGSGRKYKKCHLPIDEAAHANIRHESQVHRLDNDLVEVLSEFAVARFGDRWLDFERDFEDPDVATQLAAPWSVYGYAVDGETVVDAYLEAEGTRCTPAVRRWLEAQRAAWLSIWEVIEVDRGRSVMLQDLLTGETRRVQEVRGSQVLVVRDALLARVVDDDDGSLLCGAHPRPLPPLAAAEVVRKARGRLRRKRAVPVDRLRDAAVGRYLIRRWEDAVAEQDVRRLVPPTLCNTDGDPLLLTTDHFDLSPGARDEVATRLATLDGVQPPGPGEEEPLVYTFVREGFDAAPGLESTITGRACLGETTLELETNSQRRADALRQQVEAVCGDRVTYKIREHTDPLSPKVGVDDGDEVDEPSPPEAEQVLLEWKQRHYADWPDHPLPALGEQTPRDAVRTAAGRLAVETLLKHLEHHEHRAPGGAVFDFSGIRRQLGLD